jgi:hypothetical protein
MNVMDMIDFDEALDDAFPGTSFELDDDIGDDGGRYVIIEWRDGPSEAQVETLVRKYLSYCMVIVHRSCGAAA